MEADSENPVPYIGLEHIESWTGRILPLDYTLVPEGVSNRFRAGNTLLGKLRPYLAKACNVEFEGLCSSEFLVLRAREQDKRFLLYCLLADGFVSIVDASTFGAKMPRASWDFIGACDLPVPPDPESQAIADFLEVQAARLETLGTKKRELIEKLKERRTALISQTVMHGLPPAAARAVGLKPRPKLKQSGIEWLGDIPEMWKVKSVKRAAREGRKTFTDGDWIESPFVTDGGVRLIQTGNVGIGVFREQGFRYVSEETFVSLRCTEVLPNDVLICRLDGPVGRACLAPDLGIRMITSVDNAILKPAETVDPRYVVYLMSSSNWLEWFQTISRAGGGFRFRVSRSALGETRIPMPPLDEQQAIADYLDRETAKIDRMVAKIEAAIERLQEYRTALITAAVTGKIDVRDQRREH